MDTALPIFLFFGFLVGSSILILVCGIQSRDGDEGDAAANRLPVHELSTMPRFFGRHGQKTLANPVMVVVDEALAARVEDFLRVELALAEVCMDDPSAEGSGDTPRDEDVGYSVLERLEQYLRSEQKMVANFLSNPSVESLHRRMGGLPVSH